MIVGYARISTGDQTIALQQDALQAAGCDRVFTDRPRQVMLYIYVLFPWPNNHPSEQRHW